MAVSAEEVTSQSGPARRKSHLPSAGHSPSTSRAGRQLGSIGAKQGPGYSPYARRTYPRGAPDGLSPARDEEEHPVDGSPVASTSGGGLVSLVKGLPGKALGFLWNRGGRGDKGKGLNEVPRSQSLADLQDEARLESTGAGRGRGLPRSSSTAARLGPRRSEALSPPPRSKLASSTLPPAVSLRRPIPTFDAPRNSTAGPSTTPFLARSRIASPALSTGSGYSRNGRSPSPTRAGLAGSMSAFNLLSNAPPLPSPTASSAIFAPRASGSTTNQFGLKSRSPFVGRSPSSFSRLGSPGARSVTSSTGGGGGLFPYTSTIPRGNSSYALNVQAGPPQSPGQGTKRAYSDAGGSPPRSATYARFGSPLNPFGAPGSVVGGPDERARKKQLVWDPEKGLVSREALEREAERARCAVWLWESDERALTRFRRPTREARPVPKNEAERILEVLEGMGRTPMGEAKRAFATKVRLSPVAHLRLRTDARAH